MTIAAPSRHRSRRRLWWWIALALVLAVAAVTALVLLSRARTERDPLDPDSVTPYGSRALATLLDDRGITISEYGKSAALLRAAGSGPATILVPFPDLLRTDTVLRLRSLPSSVRVVLVQPGPLTVRDLATGTDPPILTVDRRDAGPDAPEPGCTVEEALVAGGADVLRGASLRYTADRVCYQGGLALGGSGDRAELVVLASTVPLTNGALAERGNAALMIGLLDDHPRVLWLSLAGPEPLPPPTVSEPAGGYPEDRDNTEEPPRADNGPTEWDALPPWAGALAAQLVLVALLAMLWRGRRLGPPVGEPLPVVVRSAETTEGRARLYQRAGDRARAAQALRHAAVAGLRPVLAPDEPPAPRLAAITGRSPAEIAALLHGPPPKDDAGLVALADELDRLVTAVLHAHYPTGTRSRS